jgi:dipeptidyl aminopeptidase/acylaminoacyl peptidase
MPTRRQLLIVALASTIPACRASPPVPRAEAVKDTDGDSADDAADDPGADDGRGTETIELEPIAPTTPPPFSALDLLAMDRISDPRVSPDGRSVAFVRRVTDLAANRGRTHLWVVPSSGGKPKPLTRGEGTDHHPRWAPDGDVLYFLSARSGSTQIWKLVSQDGGWAEPEQVTDHPVPVADLVVSPDGDHLAFTADVFVDCEDLACTAARTKREDDAAHTGLRFDKLFARHWDTWKDGRRSHVFVVPTQGGDPIDLSAGMDADVPSRPFGGAEEIAFTPDGKTLVFAARDVGKGEAWSTNFDLFAAPLDGGPRRNLTADNLAWDTTPVFSPDGTQLVFKAMTRPGYEADRFGLRAMQWPSGETRSVADDWDRSIDDLVFAPDGKSLIVSAQNVGQKSLFTISLHDGRVQELVGAGTSSSPVPAGDRIVYLNHDLTRPAELFSIPLAGGEPQALTSLNATKVELAHTGRPEQFSFVGAEGDTVYGYLVHPVDFDPAQRYPVAFLIHGGPQGSFGNMFHYRWNPQVYAGAGYGVVMIDFHGSTGYGQAFTDAIRNDWGGKPLVDLQKGLAAVAAEHPWIDRDRVCALGASYGGYMINWIAGQWPDGFQCLVNHDGVFDMRMMYYATEELWFPEWEHLGPYHDRPDDHEKHNPVHHVNAWKTPMLVIHGSRDFRVPETQGLAAFTALQRRGIDSELLIFPDENHWVLAPANSLQWHDVVTRWLDRHLRGP